MASTDLISTAKIYFPTLQIKYKNQDPLMKLLGKILFFTPGFMTDYLTTLGSIIYVPSEAYIQNNSKTFNDVFIHECVHLYDTKRIGFLYSIANALPQILAPVSLLLLFVLNWYFVLPLTLLFLCPLPAYFRMYFERRAYFVQMFVSYNLYGFEPADSIIWMNKHFVDSTYYFMWVFGQKDQFTQEAANVKTGNPTCKTEPALFQMVNDLIAAARK